MKNWWNKLIGIDVSESPVEKLIEKLPETDEVEKVYQARWVWYHTILAVELLFTNLLLLALLVVTSFK